MPTANTFQMWVRSFKACRTSLGRWHLIMWSKRTVKLSRMCATFCFKREMAVKVLLYLSMVVLASVDCICSTKNVT
jgi:hypothetical protein